MVIQFLLGVISSFLQLIFSIMPDIPPMPSFIDTSITFFLTIIDQVIGVFAWLYTPAIFIFGVTVVIFTLNFKNIYHFIMFIVHKIPVGTK